MSDGVGAIEIVLTNGARSTHLLRSGATGPTGPAGVSITHVGRTGPPTAPWALRLSLSSGESVDVDMPVIRPPRFHGTTHAAPDTQTVDVALGDTVIIGTRFAVYATNDRGVPEWRTLVTVT